MKAQLHILLWGILALLIGFTPQAQALEFSAHGYYRIRFEYTHDLDLQKPNAGIVPGDLTNNSNDRFGTIAFAQQRFRLNPNLKINDHISIHGQIDFLDNLLFGQSDVAVINIYNPLEGTVKMTPANGPYGVIGPTAGDPLGSGGGNVNVRRLWVDILTSAGQFRIGRQPSQWGLGIFNNDGDCMECDFGDTFDRILYLAGIGLKNGGRVNFGLAYDFAYASTRDPSLGGLEDDVKRFNDMMQGGMFVLYQGRNFEIGVFGGLRFRDGLNGQTTTTALYVDDCGADDGRPVEFQCSDGTDTTDPNHDLDNDGVTNDLIELPAGKDGNTLAYAIDIYGSFTFLRHYTFSFEAVYIGGKIAPGIAIDAIALDAPSQSGIKNPLTSPIEVPLVGTQNDLSILMAAMEFDAEWDFGGEVHIQAGYASGDQNPMSSKVTQFGFRPDYDIALILFDMPIGTSPALVIGGVTELGRVPMTANYINNAIYFTFEYKHEFDISSGVPWAKDFKVGLKGITAIAPKNNLDLNLSEIVSASSGETVTTLPHVVNRSKWYGFEVDASVEATFFDALKWKTVAGIFVPGPLYDIKNDAAAENPSGIVDVILFDKADIAFAVKTTLFIEF